MNNNYKTELTKALDAIFAETIRAKSMFPEYFSSQHEAYAVLLEETDELWDEIKKNQRNYDLEAQRKEAIQAAAMLCRFIVELVPIPELNKKQ
jgi:NTP pyrophosphatase (non-canonical NTP hydrolase)